MRLSIWPEGVRPSVAVPASRPIVALATPRTKARAYGFFFCGMTMLPRT